MSTTETLALARAEIHDAVAAYDEPQRRHQCAHAARSYAATVLLADDATDAQRRDARCYLDDAVAMLTTT
ncbi:hypothetical protein BTO20_37565 (plasmid) [Mycobacterium dioxanotrophicus]|jgi:hypothetical protein|uniref:Uncharacterized protein n=1 Tax=Mycobacterium dioxanotrophicus TaxID=482462 RepID=A0A1Y0CH03_9MYCO|nr:hypothetical protein [Mycobacterium dioxanotrophicus]ART74334.1 hypothetical protein BTO20_37565 [Mycobacterium dioxanotrophicus]